MSEAISFAQEIEANKNAAEVPGKAVTIQTAGSSLKVRLRGAYITECQLTSPSSGQRIDVLYAETETTKPKLTATHSMVPAGPYDGIGGQHGFPRWADYLQLPSSDVQSREKQLVLRAERSDNGISLAKTFELTESTMIISTTIANPKAETEQTSMGEHLYFSLAGGDYTKPAAHTEAALV